MFPSEMSTPGVFFLEFGGMMLRNTPDRNAGGRGSTPDPLRRFFSSSRTIQPCLFGRLRYSTTISCDTYVLELKIRRGPSPRPGPGRGLEPAPRPTPRFSKGPGSNRVRPLTLLSSFHAIYLSSPGHLHDST